MTNTDTWTWLVTHGDYPESVCIGRDSERKIQRFLDAHDHYQHIVRPVGTHWDGHKV